MWNLEATAAVIGIFAALVAMAWGCSGSLPRATGAVTRLFWCPSRDQDVTGEFQEEPWSEWTGFSPSTAVGCATWGLRSGRWRPVQAGTGTA